jgi:hypothetical protein
MRMAPAAHWPIVSESGSFQSPENILLISPARQNFEFLPATHRGTDLKRFARQS